RQGAGRGAAGNRRLTHAGDPVRRDPAGRSGLHQLRDLPFRREHPVRHRPRSGRRRRAGLLADPDPEGLQVSPDRNLHPGDLRARSGVGFYLRPAACEGDLRMMRYGPLRPTLAVALALALAACGDSGKEAEQHLAAGRALLTEGKHAAALPELQRAVEVNKESIPALVALGTAYAGFKRYDD